MDKGLLIQELTIYHKERPGALERLIKALENKTVTGSDYEYCACAKVIGEPAEEFHDITEAAIALSDEMISRLNLHHGHSAFTPMEIVCMHMKPGIPLDAEGQELLALCQEILQKENTPYDH